MNCSVHFFSAKPRVVEPSCLAYAILAPLALFFVDLHKASLPQNMSVRQSLKNGAERILCRAYTLIFHANEKLKCYKCIQNSYVQDATQF